MIDEIDPTAGFCETKRLRRINTVDAVTRVQVYCRAPESGWAAYDLAAAKARSLGVFAEVAPWSLLWAQALAGQIDTRNVADFTHAARQHFADLVSAVDATPLGQMTEAQLESVVRLCQWGFQGVQSAKVTKLAALYRPHAVPILDTLISKAFGLGADGFRDDGNIRSVIHALHSWLHNHKHDLDQIREHVGPVIADEKQRGLLMSDVRLLDIIIWTSQDDTTERKNKGQNRWLNGNPSAPLYSLGDQDPVPIP